MIARAIPKTGPRRCRLLYIEDSAANLGRVEELLAGRKSVLLLHAADVNLGIKLARSKHPEVILINIDLPGFDAERGAFDLMKLLRADPAMETAPILALSANAAPAAVVEGLEAGFFQYLTKPIQAGPLMEALDYALEFVALERTEQTGVPSRGSSQRSKERARP
jgi:CheY-like chemotaxis protein